jgi:hypothetical protein
MLYFLSFLLSRRTAIPAADCYITPRKFSKQKTKNKKQKTKNLLVLFTANPRATTRVEKKRKYACSL